MENYKKMYEELLEIEKIHKKENGELRKKLKELEDNQIDLLSVYINGVFDERTRWRNKIQTNKEFLTEEQIDRLLTEYK